MIQYIMTMGIDLLSAIYRNMRRLDSGTKARPEYD